MTAPAMPNVPVTPELAPLAAWVAGYRADPQDAGMRSRLRTTLLDWVSALIAGLGHPLHARYRAALLRGDETGPCRIIGETGGHPLAQAASLHAAISHFWEVDDAHRDSTTHPGITVVPAVLAVAEARALDAATTAAAIVAGFETVLRIGSHLGSEHYRVNHSTATAGTLGAAVGAARALGLDAQGALNALGHAGTQAGGLWAFLDDGVTEAKAFHAAMAVRNGLAAAHMAEAGIASAPRILEAPRGMRAAWKLESCDAAWLYPGDSEMIHTVTVKGWPVCGQMHSALDCANALAGDLLAAGDGPVTVHLPQSALAIAGVENPQTVTEAKFSTSFCIAATLLGRPPTLTGLTEDLLADPAIRARAAQVRLAEEPVFTARFPRERPARVTLHGPQDVSEERAYRRGDPEVPWSDDDMTHRTTEVLALTEWSCDAARLVAWADSFAALSPDWRATSLHDLVAAPRP
ncbi:MmgE/PrpD family protein [Roseovarius sp. MMSF_3281]|uniref:MmgE/PrpD family protein n=1 Tax=Roseovarius sp. MMSF_3281 TaxID=3046694 RepID=UPI00273E0D4D|nr:MmgE/PrpD family protein [Roseovarius sp. MMSF_3281]